MKNLELYDFLIKVDNLTEEEAALRDVYLKKIVTGKLQGPKTGIPAIDKEWLRYYSDEQISATMPKETIYQYMMKKNRNNLNSIALYYELGKKLTYRQLDRLINKSADSLVSKYNVKEGDIVTVCMPNTPEAIIIFYAINKIGAVANMIHPLSGQAEIKNFIKEANSKMVFTIDMAYSKILNVIDDTNVKNVVTITPADSMSFIKKQIYKHTKHYVPLMKDERMTTWNNFISNGDAKKAKECPYKKGKLAVMLHTGGTTGTPKGVELTNDNFNCMVEQFILNAKDFERGDKMLTIMPVFHGFGLCSSIHLPLSLGVSPILIPKLNIKKFHKTLAKYNPNHIIGVPTLFKSMLSNEKLKNMNLSYLKYIVSGGDLVKNSLESDINDFLIEHGSKAKLSKGYGLSEAVAGVTFAYDGYNAPGSIGIPMVKTNMRIVSSETGMPVDENEVGEICIKGPQVMKKYHDNPKETFSTLKDGWLHTGDSGYIKDGIFYFAQRKSDMIISSGVNVYPRNIEEVIESHDAVASCAVIGIHHSYKIEVPKAFIILKDGYEATEGLKDEIEALCKKNLNIYSIPYSYEFRENLPQTLLGKISKKDLAMEGQTVKQYRK